MRGSDRQTGQLFSYLSPEAMVPKGHPLRVIRELGDAALERLSPNFEGMYSAIGRPSIAPEQLLRALLLQAFFTVRSERQLMEQLGYNMLFRWFVGLSMDAPVWDVTVFTKNRNRLLDGDVAWEFLAALLADPRVKGVLHRLVWGSARGRMVGRRCPAIFEGSLACLSRRMPTAAIAFRSSGSGRRTGVSTTPPCVGVAV